MDRPDRNFMHAIAGDRNERIVLLLLFENRHGIGAMSQWNKVSRPCRVTQPWTLIGGIPRANAK